MFQLDSIITYGGQSYKCIYAVQHQTKSRKSPAQAFIFRSDVSQVTNWCTNIEMKWADIREAQEAAAEAKRAAKRGRKEAKTSPKVAKSPGFRQNGGKYSLKNQDDSDGGKRSHGTQSKFCHHATLSLGLDAEWFSTPGPKGEKRVVLSQQLSFIHRGAMYTWVLLPGNGDTYTLTQVLGWLFDDAAAAGLQIAPDRSKLSITMFCHFGVVDLTTFAMSRGKKGLIRKSDSLRRTLVTVEESIRVKVWSMRTRFGHLRNLCDITLRDTYVLSPAGSPLAALGDALGVPKVKLPDGCDEKDKMDEVLRKAPDAFVSYACRDSEIALIWGENVRDPMTGKVPVTLGSAAAATIRDEICKANEIVDEKGRRRKWKGKEFDYHWRGLIQTKEQVRNRNGVLKTQTVLIPRAEAAEVLDAANNAYYGGRNECYLVGIHHSEAGWSDFDLSGAYPTAMNLLPDPDYGAKPVYLRTGVLPQYAQIDPLSFMFAHIRFEFPKETLYPCLPVKDINGRGLVYPLSGETWACAPEIHLALAMNARIELLRDVRIVPPRRDEAGNPIKSLGRAMQRLVLDRLKAKEEFGAKSVQELLAKEKANSGYGKGGQGLRGKRAYSTRYDEHSDVPSSIITAAPQAALTTGLVRAIVSAAIHELGVRGHRIASVTTDGFLTDASLDDLDSLDLFGFADLFRKSRMQLVADPTIWELKHKAQSLVMIKTRGGLGIGKVGNQPLPSAGAGYKPTQKDMDRTLAGMPLSESLAITYLDRTGPIRFDYIALPRLSDYVRKNADAISKKETRTVNWEYDFKREPQAPSDETITIAGTSYTHVSYSTVPWKDMADFTTARNVVDDVKETIKTANDTEKLMDLIYSRIKARGTRAYIRDGTLQSRVRSVLRAIRSGSVTGPLLNGKTSGPEIRAKVAGHFATNVSLQQWKDAGKSERNSIIAWDLIADDLAALNLTRTEPLQKPASLSPCATPTEPSSGDVVADSTSSPSKIIPFPSKRIA